MGVLCCSDRSMQGMQPGHTYVASLGLALSCVVL